MPKTNSSTLPVTQSAPAVTLPNTIGTVALDVLGNNQPVTTAIYPKVFSTGSKGFFTNGKMILVIDGKPVPCTYQVQIVVIGSKPTA